MLLPLPRCVQAVIAAALVIVILMQRSEGGGLGMGGEPLGSHVGARCEPIS